MSKNILLNSTLVTYDAQFEETIKLYMSSHIYKK